MKKMMILLTLLCAGQLYGMSIGERLEKIHNLMAFNTFMNKLAELFPASTREEIAKKLNNPIADKYIEFNNNLVKAILTTKNPTMRLQQVNIYIKRGADINFTFKSKLDGNDVYGSILGAAYNMAIEDNGQGKNVVEFLINEGANPHVKHADTTLIEFAKKHRAFLLELLQPNGTK